MVETRLWGYSRGGFGGEEIHSILRDQPNISFVPLSPRSTRPSLNTTRTLQTAARLLLLLDPVAIIHRDQTADLGTNFWPPPRTRGR